MDLRRSILAKLVLGLVASGIALASTEIGLAHSRFANRILPYRLRLHDPNLVKEPYLRPGEHVPYTTRPGYSGHWTSGGSVTIDADGFRTDPSHPGSLKQGIDVLCMGDSFTFGYLVDDLATYPRYLGLMYGPSTVVANAGYYGGFTFDSAELRYRRMLTAHAPKVLVYGVFPGNDFDDLGVWMETDERGAPEVLRSKYQVLNEVGYSVPLLRESRLFVWLAQAWSRRMRRKRLAEREELRSRRIADAVRRFRDDTDSTGTRLVFIALREPGNVWKKYLARAWDLPLEDVRKRIEAQVDQLRAAVYENHLEWYDDAALLEGLRTGLAHHQLPEPPSGLAVSLESLQKTAAAADWDPELLVASDGVHYSRLTNVYLAAWVHARLGLEQSR